MAVSPTWACVLKRALSPREAHEALGEPTSLDANPGESPSGTGWHAARSAADRIHDH